MVKDTVANLDLSITRAEQIIQDVAKDTSRVFFTDHVSERMEQRNISSLQVIRCLRAGMISEEPVRSVKGNWEMKVESISSGDPIKVVIALDRDDNGNYIVVITTYR